MGLRKKLEKIASDTARVTATQIFQIRMGQFGQGAGGVNNVGEVTAVNGNMITMNVNGQTVTVPNVGNRIVGKGDKMVTDGNNFAL